MEGPSLFLAAEQLSQLIGEVIGDVTGNTRIGKERLLHKKVLDIFAWGKHLVFQFDTFALRVHFMLFGSFEATISHIKVTGDYPKKNRAPHLALTFKTGHVEMYSCSLLYIESVNAKDSYDYSIDIMSDQWDAAKALKKAESAARAANCRSPLRPDYFCWRGQHHPK